MNCDVVKALVEQRLQTTKKTPVVTSAVDAEEVFPFALLQKTCFIPLKNHKTTTSQHKAFYHENMSFVVFPLSDMTIAVKQK